MDKDQPRPSDPRHLENLPDVCDLGQVANYLGIGRSTAYGLVRQRRLRAVRVGRRILVPKSSLVALLAPREAPRK